MTNPTDRSIKVNTQFVTRSNYKYSNIKIINDVDTYSVLYEYN